MLSASLVYGQTYRLSGHIYDENGSPIDLAIVSLNKSLWVTTDKDGRYEFSK